MEKSELKDLLLRYSVGECTQAEALWVENWYNQQDSNESLPVSDEEFENHIETIYHRLPKAKNVGFSYLSIVVPSIVR